MSELDDANELIEAPREPEPPKTLRLELHTVKKPPQTLRLEVRSGSTFSSSPSKAQQARDWCNGLRKQAREVDGAIDQLARRAKYLLDVGLDEPDSFVDATKAELSTEIRQWITDLNIVRCRLDNMVDLDGGGGND